MNPINKIVCRFLKSREMRRRKLKITSQFKYLKVRRRLSKEQKKEVLDYYKGLVGRRVSLHCHEYFYSRTGVYNKEYVPANFYHCELVPRANIHSLGSALGDKNMCDFLFPGENVVHSILKRINGYYYYEGVPISPEEAMSSFQNVDNVIIKPANKSKGSDVHLLSVKNGITNYKGKTVEQLFASYGNDFLIQERVKQHKDMAALNPTSLNTLRVLSYRSGMEILIIYSVVRIGKSGQVIDNQSAGGISTSVDKTGKLGKFAYGGYTEDDILTTDSGIILDGYQIPSYDKVEEMVKRLHFKLPYFDIVGWDMAVQEDGNPVLIEFNVNPGLSQSAFHSGMGEYTERIIRELWPRPNTWFPC